MTFYQNIKANFATIDSVFFQLKKECDIYKTLFAIRTFYCVRDELMRHKKEHTVKYKMVCVLRSIKWIMLFPFMKITVSNRSSKVILGNWRFDYSLSEKLNIPVLKLKRNYTYPRLSTVIGGCKSFFCFFYLLFCCKLRFNKIIWMLPEVYTFWKYYQSVDLEGINVVITENDILPLNVAILYKAKEMGVKRVKIEYVQIDSLCHNNVFCDYYFYPTCYHKLIRENSNWDNSSLVYVYGGYLNTEYLEYRNLSDGKNSFLFHITYFTAHSNLFVHDDKYYIEEILQAMPPGFVLNIKIHPYEELEKYEYLKCNKSVRLYTFDSVSNMELIAQSQFCFSQFSVMSLEAKSVCRHSYFLNYAWQESYLAQDYEYCRTFFDIIDTPELLRQVLSGKYQPVSFETFHQNVNMTFPHTFEVFEKFLAEV